MFTGIIEEVGTIKSMTAGESSGEIRVQARTVLEGTKIGDSIAVNGICLTVTSLQPDGFTADVMAETVRRSALREQNPGSKVNLERAMVADGRFGGHMVSGHIDGTGKVVSLEREENAVWVTIEAPAEILRLRVEKGSIAIDGISLTVAYVDERVFKVSIIPHTGAETTLLDRKAGDSVNLENDITGKYVEKLLAAGVSTPYSAGSRTGPEDRQQPPGEDGLTMEYLEKMGI